MSKVKLSPENFAAQREKHEALTSRLEKQAEANPVGYQRRVGALAVLGFGYIFGVLALCLGLLLSLLWIVVYGHHLNVLMVKVGFILGVFTFAVLRSLVVLLPAPEGRVLTPAEAPQLFVDIDEISIKLCAPKPHKVLLTDEMNAAVTQVPRFGLLGGQRSYLIVGLQLMSALTPLEFKSVLAHEYGHLSGNHSRFSGWIYRARATWSRLLDSFEGGYNWVFSPFFRWYSPYFAAYSFVLARQNEYVADACAAELCGARVTAVPGLRTEEPGAWGRALLCGSAAPGARGRNGPTGPGPSDSAGTTRHPGSLHAGRILLAPARASSGRRSLGGSGSRL